MTGAAPSTAPETPPGRLWCGRHLRTCRVLLMGVLSTSQQGWRTACDGEALIMEATPPIAFSGIQQQLSFKEQYMVRSGPRPCVSGLSAMQLHLARLSLMK